MDLDDLKFESIVSTMTRLLVMYKVRGGGNFVVPARLPEYGNQNVLDKGNIVEIVVEIKCSFGQQYPPPGIIGRFLAWLTDVDYYGECWQHGAFLSYNKHDVFLYESEDCEPHEDGTESKFAGITLGVQGVRTEAREVLTALKKSLEQLVSDSAYGYPGLAPLMSFEEPVETKSTELGELRRRLDNLDERLEKIERKLDGVANQVAEQLLFAASATQDMCPYPRLVILVPVDDKLPVDNESGTRGQFQRKGWVRWKEAWEKLEGSVELNNKFSLRFLCEYNLAEVPCGPDGRGYLLEVPKEWVKKCIPLMQVRQGNRFHFRVRVEVASGSGHHQVKALIDSKLLSFHSLRRTVKAVSVLLLFCVPFFLSRPFVVTLDATRYLRQCRKPARLANRFACSPSWPQTTDYLRFFSGVAVDLADRSWFRVERGPAHERAAECGREDHRCCTRGWDRHGGS